MSFSGLVVDRDGNPLAGIAVRLVDSNGARFEQATGSDGSFDFSVAAGQYSMDVDGDLGSTGFSYGGSIDLTASASGGLRARLQLPGRAPG